jgi:hypothetical protein
MRWATSITLMLLISFVWLPWPAAAGEAALVKLDETGRELPNSAPNWVMVLDRDTGLIWENKSSDGSLHDKDNLYSWNNIQHIFIKGLNQEKFGGYEDWRLPEEHELGRLQKIMTDDPGRFAKYFPLTVPSTYWTWGRCQDGSKNSVKLKFGPQPSEDKRRHRIRAVRGDLRE